MCCEVEKRQFVALAEFVYEILRDIEAKEDGISFGPTASDDLRTLIWEVEGPCI